MKLTKVYIRANYNAPGYHGTIEVQGSDGKIECNLNDEQARKLVEVMSGALVATAKEVADQLAKSMVVPKGEPM